MKPDLMRYLQQGRDVLLWKLDGVSEYDARRPMVPTGTNLLGLVKHVATVESGYFGEVFGRPFETLPMEDVHNVDMYATADETRDEIIDFYKRVWAHSDETIEQLDLDAPGLVPWWSEERKHVTLHRVLIHMIAETHRHSGHADILRELIDGQAGHRADYDNLDNPESWEEQWQLLEEIAQSKKAQGKR